MGVLAAAPFAVGYTYHRTKGKILDKTIICPDMIPPINPVADWRYMHQHQQAQTNKDVIRENTARKDHNYIVGDKIRKKRKSL